MRTAGWIIICLGFASALLWNYLGRDNVGVMAVGGLSIVAGMILLAIDAIVRMSRGQLRLRPLDAMKRMPLIFMVMVGVYALALVIFPETQFDWTAILIRCAIVSLTMALYFSADRKPA